MVLHDVVIVGAGASGLSAAGALKAAGVNAVLLERDDDVGSSWLQRYDRLHLHTARAFSGLAHWGVPRTAPRYMSRNEYAEYLQAYASHFRLHVVAHTPVHRIERTQVNVAPAGAEPVSRQLFVLRSPRQDWRARAVVVATGNFSIPVIPDWPGRDNYSGVFMHSAHYRNGTSFRGKRALVIGTGNSGAEIATDLAECGASHVAISVRTPRVVVARERFGIPVQVVGLLVSLLPRSLVERVAARLASRAGSILTEHGLSAGPLTSKPHEIPIIDVGFRAEMQAGRIQARSSVAEFTSEGVRFVNGVHEAFDVVVAATGYSNGVQQLVGDTPSDSGSSTGLFTVGFSPSRRGQLFESHHESLRLAHLVQEYLRNDSIG